jgi:hypothetical protein
MVVGFAITPSHPPTPGSPATAVLAAGYGAVTAYFLAAGLCEIGGGYLVWLWLREGKSVWLAVLGAVVLVLYGIILTLQPANFGRV